MMMASKSRAPRRGIGRDREVEMRAAGIPFAALLVASLAGPAIGADSDDPPPLSAAQLALFETNHLRGISAPLVIDYHFTHRGAPKGDFEDKVSADIRAVREDGRKDVWIDFLTGEHHVPFPPVLGFNGNPLLMFFLEHDVMEMRDVTGGAAQYFRTRLRQSFVDRAEMREVEFEYEGAPRKGTEIDVTPFRNDGNLARFPAFAGKTYRFILSDAVPGGVYQISTEVPSEGAQEGVFRDQMIFAGTHPEQQ
jgi:hypothetical protein